MKSRVNRLVKFLPALMLLLPSCQSVQAADNSAVLLASSNSLRMYQHSGCQLNDTQSRKLQEGLSEIQGVYAHTLGYSESPTQPLTVQLFCTEQAFRAYGQSTGNDTSSDTGYYSLQRREMVIYSKYGLDQSLQTIYHEASHALMRSVPAPYPKWLNEGLAEYFEGGEPSPGALVVSPQQVKEERVQKMLKFNRLPSLQSYLSLSNQDWQMGNSPEPISSTLGWSLVYFLMETPTGQAQVRELVKLHQQSIVPAEAVEKVYPGGVAQLEQDWHSWLSQPRRNHVW